MMTEHEYWETRTYSERMEILDRCNVTELSDLFVTFIELPDCVKIFIFNLGVGRAA